MSSRTVYLRTGSHDYRTREHNGSFTVILDHWPVEFNDGCKGISVDSVTFPQNVHNVQTYNNVFKWEPTDDTKNTNTVTLDPTTTIEWKADITGQNDQWNTFTPTFTTVFAAGDKAALIIALNAEWQAHYNSVLGLPATDTAWALTDPTVSGGYSNVIEFNKAANSPTINFRYSPGLVALGFTDVTKYPGGSTTQPPQGGYYMIGSSPPWAYTTTVPTGQYDIDQLLDVLELDVDTKYAASAPNVVVESSVTDQRLLWSHAAGETLILYGDRFGSTLAPLLGVSSDYITTSGSTGLLPYVANMHGPNTLYLHSSIMAGRSTVDGDGGLISMAKTIPITAGYRELQTWDQNDNGVPDIAFPRSKHFTEINMALRDVQGRSVDLGTGNLEVLWKLYY